MHATNVHQGGGKALLEALLETSFTQEKRVLLLDARMRISTEILGNSRLIRVSPSVFHRLRAEWWLARHVHAADTVICFGNLPPLFKVAGHVIVFVQNKYLLQDVCLEGFSWKTRLRLSIERLWFKWKAINADQFIVQTPAMKAVLESRLSGHITSNKGTILPTEHRVSIQILPFVSAVEGYQRKLATMRRKGKQDFDFFYVASGEPHKNHRCLIEAWCLLAKEGLFPSLKLTLDRPHFAELCSWIEQKVEQGRLKVDNTGSLSHGQVKRLYGRAGALIYPSTFESFGLPLIEARQAGLPVLASELDYVRDVLDPEQTFDPESAVSIARAVKRFMGIEEQPLPLQDAAGFMKYILERAE